LSKHLSYLLRHHPGSGDLVLDDRGFVSLKSVLNSLEDTKHSWASREDIEELIKKNEEKRFEIVGGKIRALYGHSIDVRIEKKDEPPAELYHGTSPGSLNSILDEGLRPMGRQYVHLSTSVEEAFEVGKRHHPDPILLEIEALEAWEEDIDFYKRGDIYLSERIPSRYISVQS
ncbi:MAG: RNA 2'-phosphotransferase, partial [Candidatus Natronoplasma sp.]